MLLYTSKKALCMILLMLNYKQRYLDIIYINSYSMFFILPEDMSLQTLIMLYVNVHACLYLQHVAIVVSIFFNSNICTWLIITDKRLKIIIFLYQSEKPLNTAFSSDMYVLKIFLFNAYEKKNTCNISTNVFILQEWNEALITVLLWPQY